MVRQTWKKGIVNSNQATMMKLVMTLRSRKRHIMVLAWLSHTTDHDSAKIPSVASETPILKFQNTRNKTKDKGFKNLVYASVTGSKALNMAKLCNNKYWPLIELDKETDQCHGNTNPVDSVSNAENPSPTDKVGDLMSDVIKMKVKSRVQCVKNLDNSEYSKVLKNNTKAMMLMWLNKTPSSCDKKVI